jgi:ABC-2 type transport system permease protein
MLEAAEAAPPCIALRSMARRAQSAPICLESSSPAPTRLFRSMANVLLPNLPPATVRFNHVAVLPSEDFEAQVLWRLRYGIAVEQCQQLFKSARLRTALVVSLSVCFWFGLFVLFQQGFRFVVEHVGPPGANYHAQTVRFVFHLFFASLNVMLIFSSAIILYTGLFNSPETRFLLTLPVRAERLVLYKFQEAVFFSSWGFFLLASPMMIAYGIVVGAPWYYYCLLLPLIIAFVYIPSGIGALCCLLVIYKLPRLRNVIVGGAALIAIGFAAGSIWVTVNGPQARLFGSQWFEETLHRFRFTQQEWLPSSWLTGGLLEAARPYQLAEHYQNAMRIPIIQSCMYLALLVSNAMLCHVLTIWAAKHWFRKSYADFSCRHKRRRYARVSILDRGAYRLLAGFARPLRLLLIKDWRLLRRDPVQWSQFLIFFGLLTLYFLNIDRFSNPNRDISYVTWINMVSFLNLAVVGLILSTFTTRFIYPMISLEGHCFWVLGLLPMQRDTILWSKFLFASLGSWVPCAVLILLSDLMLHVAGLVVVVHQLTCVLLCMGLASIAVGLGAMMPNFHETSPSKIAAGFGGTLNLVLSALYIIVIVVLSALPCHFYLIAGNAPWHESFLNPGLIKVWLWGGSTVALAVGAIATILPLRWGLRSFRQMEIN